MRGSITRRGKNSWRIKYDVPGSGTGRETRYVTVCGKRADAERELTRLISAVHDGVSVEPSKITVAEYLKSWLGGTHGYANKTRERFGEIITLYVNPHLGNILLQRLRPAHISDWHTKLLTAGGRKGRPLSARTVTHAHKLLHLAIGRALTNELVARNVMHAIKPPKVPHTEAKALTADQVAPVLAALKDHWLEPIAVLALSSGARRGEILALTWGDLDLANTTTMRIRRSLEQTRIAGLSFKTPKTKHSIRQLTLPPIAIEVLQAHRRRQLEQRMAMGQGKLTPETLVFSTVDGEPIAPRYLTRMWGQFIVAHGLPRIGFHGLRHSHVAALIASKVDPLTISRRVGHSSPVVTMTIYAHLFDNTDAGAASAIEATLRTDKG